MRLPVVCASLIAGVAACTAIGSWAQPYPTKPIRIISSFPPGGTTDVLARIIATEMTRTIGQPVIVENRSGAGSVVGTNAIAQAPGDGYTIGLIISAHAVHPGMETKLPYDSASDFTAISLLWLPRLRDLRVVRAVRAGKGAEGDRRAARPGGRENPQGPRAPRAHARAGRGARRQLARGVRALRARRDGQVGCAREENKPPSRLNSDMDKWRPIVRATDLILDALFEAGRMEVTVGGCACAPF